MIIVVRWMTLLNIELNIKMSVKTYTQPLKSLVYIMVRIPIIKMIKSSQQP